LLPMALTMPIPVMATRRTVHLSASLEHQTGVHSPSPALDGEKQQSMGDPLAADCARRVLRLSVN
jgi:hypothetical protein